MGYNKRISCGFLHRTIRDAQNIESLWDIVTKNLFFAKMMINELIPRIFAVGKLIVL